MNDRQVRVERKRLIRREFVLLIRRGRVLVQLGGTIRGRSGWMTRSVADTDAEASLDLQTMLDQYTDEGYRQVLWDDEAAPDVPDEIFDPAS